MLEQRIVLGHDADFSGLNRAVLAVDGYAARSRLIQAGDDAEQLGLADAAGPQEAYNLALRAVGTDNVLDLCADVLEDGPAIVLERNVLDLQQRLAVSVGNHNLVEARLCSGSSGPVHLRVFSHTRSICDVYLRAFISSPLFPGVYFLSRVKSA